MKWATMHNSRAPCSVTILWPSCMPLLLTAVRPLPSKNADINSDIRTIKLWPPHCLICLGMKSNFKKCLNFYSVPLLNQITVAPYLSLPLIDLHWHWPRALQLCGTALLRGDNSCLGLTSMERDVLWTSCECHVQRRHAAPQFLWPQGAV